MSTDSSSGQRLGPLTTVDVAAHSATVLLIPLGSTEQHGPHLPLETDTFIASAWCDALARGRQDVLVAPALPYGSAGEHQAFAGTLSIGQDALSCVLVELARSAAHQFSRVVFVSGHAGNAGVLGHVVQQLRHEGHDVAALVPILPGADAHAGRTETSIMLKLDPSQVRSDKAEPGNVQPLNEILAALREEGVAAVSSNGILGDPTDASAAEGEELLAVLGLVSIYDRGHC